MAQKRQQYQSKAEDKAPAAETLIEGRLAGPGFAERLRALSPVTAGLVLAVLVAVGLSAWPYLAPLVYPEPDDPWKITVDQDLAELRRALTIVNDQQTELTQTLETMQTRLDELDSNMAGLVQSVTQSVDTLTVAIDRFDQQMALMDERRAAPADQTKTAPSGPAEGVSSSESDLTAPAQNPGDNRLLPDVSLPEISGWWQSLSGWFSGLVSVDRISPEQDQ